MTLSLIYPHQLFQNHPAIQAGRQVYLVEDPLFFGTDSEQPLRFHAKKLMLHRASMKHFADLNDVTYIDLPEVPCRSDELLEMVIPQEVTEIACVDPVDYLLERRIRRFCEGRGIRLTLLSSPMFLTPDDWMTEIMDGMKKPFMKKFYEVQRKRMGILLEPDGKPLGGKWSYDVDNRKKLPKKIAIPEPFNPHILRSRRQKNG